MIQSYMLHRDYKKSSTQGVKRVMRCPYCENNHVRPVGEQRELTVRGKKYFQTFYFCDLCKQGFTTEWL